MVNDKDDEDLESSAAPLIEHLSELRNRLIRCAVAFTLAMILCFAVASEIFNFLAAPIVKVLIENGQEPDLIFTGLQQGFMVNIQISLFEMHQMPIQWLTAQQKMMKMLLVVPIQRHNHNNVSNVSLLLH